MRALLHDARERQEAYRAEHGYYAAHWRLLNDGQDTLADGTRVSIADATATGWIASSSHPSLFRAACATYHGQIRGRVKLVGLRGPFEPDQVICNDFTKWAKRRIIEPALYAADGTLLDYDSVQQASWQR